jgi:TolB-like protein
VAEASHAVFLSYASQDTEAAQKICEALRAAGIEVFLDQSELRGGDVWDEKIRREIHDCALFIPVISVNTASRHEGYFRLEWDLADQRSHMMARSRVFVVPVCLDATTEAAADVPESFRRAQWTRLPAGETPPAFVERLRRLLSPEAPAATRSPATAMSGAAATVGEPIRASRWAKPLLLALGAVLGFAALAYFVADKFWIAKHLTQSPAVFSPPAHSIAVLPFVNISGDKEQEYFSEGLTEEILNSLARINELQVAARTSSFSFQGEHPDIATVAHKLNVGAVLEGSVRRSGNTVRITTQLINAVSGFHLWSETYDRDLGDVLKLETEIANAVASALKVSLLGDVAAKIELGGTRNPAAFDAYLRGRKAGLAAHDAKDYRIAIAAYTEAIGLDPNYALAFASRSLELVDYFEVQGGNAEALESISTSRNELYDKAQADARKAIALAPDLADGHLALALYFQSGALDYTRASGEFERAFALAPGDAQVLRYYGTFAVRMGRIEAGVAAARRGVMVDPLSRGSHRQLGLNLYYARQSKEAVAALQDALVLDPEYALAYADRGLAYYAVGDIERARASCETKPDFWESQQCLAITYDKLGRHTEAEGMLAKLKAQSGDTAAFQYVEIYAQWGNTPKALEWLDKALQLRDEGLVDTKVEPLLDPLRKEPRFKAVMRELKFPD